MLPYYFFKEDAMRKQNEKKPRVVQKEPEKKKYHVEFDTIILKDKVGKELKAKKVTWSDLAIMRLAGIIGFPVFLTFVNTDEDKYYAVFSDMQNNTDIPYVVNIGGYDDVAGSYVKTDDIELNNFFTKMAPKKEEK